MSEPIDPRTTVRGGELDPEVAVEQLAAIEDPDPEAIVDELDDDDPRDPSVELDPEDAPPSA